MEHDLREINKRSYTFVTPRERVSTWPLLIVAILTITAALVGWAARGVALGGSVVTYNETLTPTSIPTLAPTKDIAATVVAVIKPSPTVTRTPTRVPHTPTPSPTATKVLDPCNQAQFLERCIPYLTSTPFPPSATPTPEGVCQPDAYKDSLLIAEPCRNNQGVNPWSS